MSVWSQLRSAGELITERRGRVLSAISVLTLSSGIGQLAIFATLPLVTRLYDPSAFGMHAMVMAFVSVASVAVCMCLEQAIASAHSDEAAREFFAAALVRIPFTTLISGLIFAALVFFDLSGYGRLPLWCIPIAMLVLALNGVYLAGRYFTLRQQGFSAIARTTLVQNIGRALGPVILFPLAPFWVGLTGGEIIGRSVGVRGLLRPVWQERLAANVWGQPRSWLSLARREYRYTLVLMIAVLIDAGSSMLIVPLIAAAYGAPAAGEYYLVATMVAAPSVLLGTAVGDVLLAHGADLYRANPAALPGFARNAALALLVGGLAIYIPISALGPTLFPLILGSKWTYVARATQAMVPFLVVAFVASPCSRLLLAVNRPTVKIWSDGFRLIGVPATIYLSREGGASFLQALLNLSWFLATAYFAYFLLTYSAVTLAATQAARSSTTTQPRR